MKVVGEILSGRALSRNFCTDMIDGSSMPKRKAAAIGGTGSITLDPKRPTACGSTGTLRLNGLVARDGTTFAPIEVRSSGIGCYSG
jgi:hypothetical protein